MEFFYSQYEAKMKTLETNMKEMESKKRILEEAVDSLNEEIAKLKAKGNEHHLLIGCTISCRFSPRKKTDFLVLKLSSSLALKFDRKTVSIVMT